MKKLLSVITLLVLLVGSASAWNFKEYGKFENEKAGKYTVLIDLEATEPFDIEKENIKHLLFLQQQEEYIFVEVRWYQPTDDVTPWCIAISEKHKFYCTLEIYDNHAIEERVCSDGSVIEYICYNKINEEE